MINDARVLAIIPARGGSKRLKGKNLIDFCGKPLIAWTIEQALASQHIDDVVVSTDSNEITQVARLFGAKVPFKRPVKLASDKATSAEVVMHALTILPEYDFFVLLQPTSPLRLTKDIDICIELCHSSNIPTCVSVVDVPEETSQIYIRDEPFGLTQKSRQLEESSKDASQKECMLNGAIYCCSIQWFKKKQNFVAANSLYHVMPQERSIDIDLNVDLQMARGIMAHRQNLVAD